MCLACNTPRTAFLPLATERETQKQKCFLLGSPPEPIHQPAVTFVRRLINKILDLCMIHNEGNERESAIALRDGGSSALELVQ
jgi:hypothetical protein